jgi:hypothetical protein
MHRRIQCMREAGERGPAWQTERCTVEKSGWTDRQAGRRQTDAHADRMQEGSGGARPREGGACSFDILGEVDSIFPPGLGMRAAAWVQGRLSEIADPGGMAQHCVAVIATGRIAQDARNRTGQTESNRAGVRGIGQTESHRTDERRLTGRETVRCKDR